MKYLLDTNICIYIIKKKPPEVLEKFNSFPVGEIGLSSITVAELKSKGTPIGPLDNLIASHALSLNVTLVTNNTGEFQIIPGLKVINWVES
jgi:tRNA(fMet)-specific endonuclease VapC